MLSEELRRRIEALNRQSLPPKLLPTTLLPPVASSGVAAIAAPESAAHLVQTALASSVTSSSRQFYADPPVENATVHGPFGRYRYELAEFWPDAGERFAEWQPGRQAPAVRSPARRLRAETERFCTAFPGRTLFLDLETCGFAGSIVFLIGLVWNDNGQVIIDQLLARNYAEEKSALATLQEIVAGNDLLVTFNGKSFDWPMVQDRLIRHRLKTPVPTAACVAAANDRQPLLNDETAVEPVAVAEHTLPHYDVLHHARRRWKRMLPNCKLQTLEQVVCRRNRREDISGAEIPLAYHEYVRTGDDRRMRLILHHNAMDLVTLVQVAMKLTG